MSDTIGTRSPLESELSAQPRRILSALADEESMPADPILRDGDGLDSEDRLILLYELHNVVLPDLVEHGLVEFDREADAISRGSRFAQMDRVLEQRGDDHEV